MDSFNEAPKRYTKNEIGPYQGTMLHINIAL